MLRLTPCMRYPLEEGDAITFYPQDLPEEWRLDYFANEFRVLLAAPALWADESFLEQRAELDDDITLLLELDPAEAPDPQRLLSLAPAALVLRLGDSVPSWLEQADRLGSPLCLLASSAPVSDLRARIGGLSEATLSWPEGDGYGLIGPGRYCVATSEAQQPRQLRAAIEALSAAAGERHAWLWLGPSGGRLEVLRSCVQLAQLMGGVG